DLQVYLQFMNGQDFGADDPEFGMDIGFFAFTLPFVQALLGYMYVAVILAFIAAVIVHYLYGGVRLQNDSGQRATPAARVHLSVLLACSCSCARAPTGWTVTAWSFPTVATPSVLPTRM